MSNNFYLFAATIFDNNGWSFNLNASTYRLFHRSKLIRCLEIQDNINGYMNVWGLNWKKVLWKVFAGSCCRLHLAMFYLMQYIHPKNTRFYSKVDNVNVFKREKVKPNEGETETFICWI